MAAGHRLVIRTDAQTRRRRLAMACAGMLVLLACWGLYLLGKAQAPTAIERQILTEQQADSERERLLAENRRLEAQNRQLSEQVVTLTRAAEIDRAATVELRDALRQMQATVAELRKDLAFYRGIVSPEEVEAGLRVQDLVVDTAGDGGVYRLHLVLIQAVGHDGEIGGEVRVRVEGLKDGESVSLPWPDLALDSDPALVFSFRYFQEIGGTFRIPEGVEPTLVEVEVAPNGGADPITETYRWEEVVSTG